MRNLILITCATLILSACASPARYAWVKEGASDHQRTSDTSECTYQVRLNKTPTAEQKEKAQKAIEMGEEAKRKRIEKEKEEAERKRQEKENSEQN